MEWDIKNIEDIVNYINSELKNNRTMISIEKEEFRVNERVIHKRLLRLGYKKIDNQYRLKDDITSNITLSKTSYMDIEEHKEVSNDIKLKEEIKEPIELINKNIDIDKLNLLLNNLDKILKLIPTDITSNITMNTSFRTGVNDVKSFRVDTGLYKAIKERAIRENINIADIINKALEDYLNNYL